MLSFKDKFLRQLLLFCQLSPLLLLSLFMNQVSEVRGDSEKPNILILLADNWAAPHASIMGDQSVKTPTFDTIARNGVYFNHAFCQVPSCSPSRAVLLTGKVSHQLGEGANLWGNFPSYLSTFPLTLKNQENYQVGFSIKGWGPGLYLGEQQKSSTKATASGQINPAGVRAESFEKFLEGTGDQPFCFWFGSHDPHRPWTAEQQYYAGLTHEGVEVPGYLPDDPTVRWEIVDYYAEVQKFDAECGKLIELLKASGKYENTIVVMLGDNGWQMPRGLANVYDWGTRVPLAIQWPGRIKAGIESNTFVSFEDIAPTLFDLLGLSTKSMTGDSFSRVLTGASLRHRDEVFLERERHANVRQADACYPCRAIRTRDYLWIWNISSDLYPAGDPETYWAVGPYGDIDNSHTKSLLLNGVNDPKLAPFRDLAVGKRPEFELYDLRTDPWQINNVAGTPAYQRVERHLRSRVARWMKQTNDPRSTKLRTDVFDKYDYYGGEAKELRPQ